MSLNRELEEVRAEKAQWQDLQKHPAFVKLQLGVSAQATGRRKALDDLRPTSLDALIMAGSNMSELAGMNLVLGWPDIMLQQLELAERQLLERINESA